MYILIVLCFLLEPLFVVAEEGSSCTLTTGGQEGTCKLITDCPYAQDLLRKKIFPQTCGFIGKNPLVCCTTKLSHPDTSSSPVTTEPSTTTPIANLASGNVAVVSDQSSSPTTTEPSPSTTPTITHLGPVNLAVVSNETVGELSRNKCLSYYMKPLYPIFVTGGKASLAKEFPHMAIIGYGEKDDIQWQCGGSLISKRFVLTAAHCLTTKIGEAKYVRLGDLDLSTDEDEAEPQDFTVVKRIPHPLFKPPVRYHDIALLELDREVALSVYVSPACLNTENELIQTRLTATGWGNTRFGGNSSNFMMKVDLDHIPNDKCVELFGKSSTTLLPNSIVDEFQVCAGGTIGRDTCQGDSGGPLQVSLKERTYVVTVHSLIGVTSFGKACGLSRAPGIYTRVSSYISWIESIAWQNEKAYGWTLLNKKN